MDTVLPESDVGRIPAELRQRPQWVVWRTEERDGKPTKVPYRSDGSGHASSTDSDTWGRFEDAVSAASNGKFAGIGFVFTANDPFAGVDFDSCWDEGRQTGWADAWAWIGGLDSYSEWSPSGHGVHTIVRASVGRGIKRGDVEIYDRSRFFTFSGEHVQGTPETIEDRQAELDELIVAVAPPEPPKPPPRPSTPLELDDAELVEKILHSRQGAKFEALWRGRWEGAYSSQSEADLALCSSLAFWTQADAARIDTLFRRSGLMRDKWDDRRADSSYGSQTIEKALEGTSEVYDPGRSEPSRRSETVETVGVFSGGQVPTVSPSSPYREDGGDETVPPWSSEQSQHPETVTPFALPLDEFIAAKSETPIALIGDESEVLLPATGLLVMFAKGGKGKTTLTVDAALHFASGADWLGFALERPLRVLFVENEGPREPFRAKLELKRKLWEHEIAGAVFVQTLDWGAFSLADEQHASRLRGFIEEHEIDIVTGDPLDTLGVDGVGSPEDTRKFMALMSRVGLFQDVAFMLLHHPRKEGAQEELDEISGAWGGKPDTILRLDKLADNRARLSFPKVRWSRRGSRRALILAFDPDTENFTVAHEEEDEERDYVAEITELLSDGSWRVVREIAAPKKDGGIGANFDTVKELLETNPARFVSCNGKEVGRSAQATVWHLAEEVEPT
jgi:putative DNA primase/helicase